MININLIKVRSSLLSSVGYDPTRMILVVKFKRSGKIYKYTSVPADLYSDLISADSIGTFFRYNIQDHFSFKEVNTTRKAVGVRSLPVKKES